MNWNDNYEKIQGFLNGIKIYTDKEIEERSVAFHEVYKGLKKAFDWGDEIFLNPALVTVTVKSYYEDIYRLKMYHKIHRN